MRAVPHRRRPSARSAAVPLAALLLSLATWGGTGAAAPAAPAASTPAATPAPAAAPPVHDRAYWKAIVDKDFAVPDGASVRDLLVDLSADLGSPDPELRDTFAYGIPAAWIYRDRRVDDATLRLLMDLWMRNLTVGIGETGNESVLLRSFSALDLSLIAALDNQAPFLTPDEFGRFLDAALDYLARERDVRGFVPGSGWHHSVAHTADLLKFLGRSPKIDAGGAKRILAAIGLKTAASTTVWIWGEDDRLAAAVMSLLRRTDVDTTSFAAFADRTVTAWQQVWENEAGIDPERYAAARNGRNLLAALEVRLALADGFAARDATRAAVLAALKRM